MPDDDGEPPQHLVAHDRGAVPPDYIDVEGVRTRDVEAAKIMSELVPQATLLALSKVARRAQFERPDNFNKVTVHFLLDRWPTHPPLARRTW